MKLDNYQCYDVAELLFKNYVKTFSIFDLADAYMRGVDLPRLSEFITMVERVNNDQTRIDIGKNVLDVAENITQLWIDVTRKTINNLRYNTDYKVKENLFDYELLA